MKLARLLALSLGLATAALAGCAAPSDDPTGEAEGASSTVAAIGYQLDDPELGTLYLRLSRTGTAVSGVALQEAPQGVGPIPRMEVNGTIDAAGKHILALTHFWGAKIDFELAEQQGALVGTRKTGTAPPVAAKLVPIPADRDVPISVSYILDKGADNCQLRAVGFQLFGMKDKKREAALNAAVGKSVDDAVKKCSGVAESVLGGAFLGVVNADIQTWSAVFDLTLPNDVYETIGEQRVSQYADGKKIALWGEVLTSGAAEKAKLGQLLEQAVEKQIGRGLIEVIGQQRKDELKTKMADRLANGELDKDFFVGQRGVAFGTKDWDPRVRTIVVTYADLKSAGLLAPDGKAKSAWQ